MDITNISSCKLPWVTTDHLCILAIILALYTVEWKELQRQHNKFQMTDSNNSSTDNVVMYELIRYVFG